MRNNYSGNAKNEEYAIIGISYAFPNTDEYNLLSSLENKVSFAKELDNCRKEQIRDYYDSIDDPAQICFSKGSFLEDIDAFDHHFFRIPPKEAKLMDPAQRKLLEIAYRAFEDAGCSEEKLKGSRTGVYVGYATFVQSNYGLMAYNIDKSLMKDGMVGNISALMPARISYYLDLKGPNVLLDTACSSSLTALYHACEGIRNSDCEMALVAGVRVNLLPVENAYLSIGVQSSDCVTRAFDQTSDGTGVGEGIGCLVVKKLSAALEDKDHIHAVIKGIAVNHDGASIGITAPNPESQTDVITRAWEKAGINPEKLSFIQTHGTGTPLGDTIEMQGIRNAFRKYTNKKNICAISNVKSNMGHLFEASGMVSVIASVLALKNRVILPTINIQNPNQQIDFIDSPIYLNTVLRKYQSEDRMICGVSSFGLSGTNCHLVLEEPREIDYASGGCCFNMLTVSAKSSYSLRETVGTYIRHFDEIEGDLHRICYTSQMGRSHYSYRIAVIGSNREELKQGLLAWFDQEENSNVFYGVHKIVSANKAERFENEYTYEEMQQENAISAKYMMLLNKLSGEKRDKVLIELAKKYVKGASIEFRKMYKEAPYLTVLPTYRFEQEHMWLPTAPKNNYIVKWVRVNAKRTETAENRQKWHYILLGTGVQHSLLYTKLKERLDIAAYYDADNIEQYSEGSILFDLSALTAAECEKDLNAFHSYCQKVYSLLYKVCKGISEKTDVKIRFLGVNTFHVEDEMPNPYQCALMSLARSIAKDCIEIDISSYDSDLCNASLDLLCSSIGKQSEQKYYALRNGCLFCQVFGECSMEKHEEPRLRENGVYVLTGGVGGIAVTIAEYLSKKERVNIVLLTRRNVIEQDKWEPSVTDFSLPEREREKLRDLLTIRENALSMEVISCDVADFEKLRGVIDGIRNKYGSVDGIIHTAGVSRDVRITDRAQPGLFKDIIVPKINGTVNLHKATMQDHLQFFIMCSSIATVFSSYGQTDYILANTFLDEYAWYRRKCGLPALTVNWCTWKEKGMAHDAGFTVDTIFRAMSCQDAIKGFCNALRTDYPRIHVGYFNERGGMRLLQKSKIEVFGRLKERQERFITGQKAKNSNSEAFSSGELKLAGRPQGDYTETERKVGTVLFDVLELREVDIYDNFFEIGMDSISGIKIAQKLSEQFKRELNVVDILRNKCINEYAKFIDSLDLESEKNGLPEKGELSVADNHYPLSPSQRGIFLLDKVQEKSTNYNVTNVVILETQLDPEKVQEAFEKLIQRHEMLRVSFHGERGKPYQIIHDVPKAEIDYAYMTDAEAKTSFKDIYEGFVKPFDISKPVLMRIKLINTVSGKSIVIYDIHHIITDGISNEILIRDFLDLYFSKPLVPLKYRYMDHIADFYRMKDTQSYKQQEQFWLKKLSGTLPVIDLPTKNGRGSIQRHDGAHKRFEISDELAKMLKLKCSENGITLYMMLYAVLNLILYRYSGQTDLIIGTPTIGRKKQYADVVGMFVNTVVMRSSVDMEQSIKKYLSNIKESVLDSFRNQDYPFSYLVEKLKGRRELDRNPVFDIMFVLQNYGIDRKSGESLGKIDSEENNVFNKSSKFDISFSAVDENERIIFDVEYNTQLFDDSLIDNMIGDYLAVAAETAGRSDVKLKDLKLISDEQLKMITTLLPNPPVVYDKRETVISMFEQSVQQYAEKEAVIYHDETLTYAQLSDRINRFADYLHKQGLERNDRIAICMQRNINTIAVIFAIMKNAMVFVPIDPMSPASRVRYVLENSEAKAVMTDCDRSDILPVKIRVLDITQIDYSDYSSDVPTVCRPDDIAYIMYTSGTTGEPKGVMLEHKNIVVFTEGFYAEFGRSSARKMLQQYSYAFDGYNEEVYTTLCSGSCLVIADKEEVLDMNKLNAIITEKGIDTVSVSAVLFAQICKYIHNPSLKTLISGGDVMKPDHIHETDNDLTIINSYGPTEASCCATYYKVDKRRSGAVPIGKNLANYGVYIMDSQLRILPIGVVGEICISGDGLARGYLGKPDLTNASFVYSPFVGERVYCTGDIGRLGCDGNIDFLGRMDHQIKIRGFRVEISEIEQAVRELVTVRDLYICAAEPDGSHKELCCYMVSESGIDIRELKNALIKKLPGYMIPQYFIRIDKMPYNNNDKVDVSALPMPKRTDSTQTVYVAPRNDIERELAEIYCDVLGLDQIGMEDNFFDVGGNSIRAIEILSELTQKGYMADINMIFQYQDIETLAKELMGSDEVVMKQKIEEMSQNLIINAMLTEKQYQADSEMQEKCDSYQKWVDDTAFDDLTVKPYHSVLLLGATGYLGSYLLNGLLQRDIGTIRCIVRAADSEEGYARIQKNYAYYFDDDLIVSMRSRIQVLCGDAAKPAFGLTESEYETLANETDCIINSAALVKHFGRYEEFLRVNVETVKNCVSFVEQNRKAELHHISTVSVGSGYIENKKYDVFTEKSVDIGQIGDNNYVNSKIEAERYIMQKRNEGIKITVYRVGNLVFDSRNGRFQQNIASSAFYGLVKSVLELGIIPDVSNTTLDFSCINETAGAILSIFDKEPLLGQSWHVYNTHPIEMVELIKMINETGLFDVKIISPEEFFAFLKTHYADDNYGKLIRSILSETGLLDKQRNMTNIHVLNDMSKKMLNALEYRFSSIDTKLIRRMLTHAISCGFIRQERIKAENDNEVRNERITGQKEQEKN